MTRKNRLFCRTSAMALLVPALATSGATSAIGQDAAGTAQAEAEATTAAVADGDIVVTARRRSESLSRVPISVASIGGDDLVARRIESQLDLQRGVPGLTVRSGQSDSVLTFSIRGQGVDNYSSSPPAVATYFNEVPLASLSASNFYDLNSIQVLKGPQGTLFGRNTTGGRCHQHSDHRRQGSAARRRQCTMA
jgi:iron complex outermembrane receptor protein